TLGMLPLQLCHPADEQIDDRQIAVLAPGLSRRGEGRSILPLFLCARCPVQLPPRKGDDLAWAVSRAAFRQILSDTEQEFSLFCSARCIALSSSRLPEAGTELLFGVLRDAVRVHQLVHDVVVERGEINVHYGVDIGGRGLADPDTRVGGHGCYVVRGLDAPENRRCCFEVRESGVQNRPERRVPKLVSDAAMGRCLGTEGPRSRSFLRGAQLIPAARERAPVPVFCQQTPRLVGAIGAIWLEKSGRMREVWGCHERFPEWPDVGSSLRFTKVAGAGV
ncbi:4982286d-bfce-4604-9371-87e9671d3244, partial [Thermothielavioides terrestris]